MEKTRPKHLDLPKIRLPIPGIVSILHRVSGAFMFLAIPVVFWLLAGSLSSEAEFDAYRGFVAYPIVKLALLGLLWAYLHHACAGIRFLLLDVHKGLELSTARATAKAVMVVSLVLTAVIGGVLW
ncbi:succinate dehydrogenase, cytochrome b556 subunit [Chitinimonas sp. PSY-7]|uniref:succinate dehydrogenase, cytochrome b556 subunit n=1 Tax=Chitinimonas sp. PSY-7 TaxID=3459088 RepID=UPI00403FFB15